MDLPASHSSTSSHSVFDGFRITVERPSCTGSVYRDMTHSIQPSDEVAEDGIRSNLVELAEHSSCSSEPLNEVFPYKHPLTYEGQTGRWEYPTGLQASDSSTTHPLRREFKDFENVSQHDAVLPTGLPVAASTESITMMADDFYQGSDFYLESASMNVETYWNETTGFLSYDGPLDCQGRALSLFAFEP